MLAAPKDPLRLSPQLLAPSGQVLEAVRKLGLEGVVGKRIGSTYEPGERSGAWIKLRTNREQDFVIGGYIPGSHGFDALLVGVYENKKFIFVAKVKNGFVPRIRDEIFPALKRVTAPHFKTLNDLWAREGSVVQENGKQCPTNTWPISWLSPCMEFQTQKDHQRHAREFCPDRNRMSALR